MTIAPDTPRHQITSNGPYHSISVNGGKPGATVDDGHHKAANRRRSRSCVRRTTGRALRLLRGALSEMCEVQEVAISFT